MTGKIDSMSSGEVAGQEQQPLLQERLTPDDVSRIRDICIENVGGEHAGQWIDNQGREFRFGLANDEVQGPLSRAILGHKHVLRISVADLTSDHPQTPFVRFNIVQRRNKLPSLRTRRIRAKKDENNDEEYRYNHPEDIAELLGYFTSDEEKADTKPNGEA